MQQTCVPLILANPFYSFVNLKGTVLRRDNYQDLTYTWLETNMLHPDFFYDIILTISNKEVFL